MNASRIPTLACILLVIALLLSLSSLASADNPLTGYTEAQFDSLARQVGQQLSKVPTAEVEKRHYHRREFQKRGYQDTLMEVLHGNGLGSILMFIRTALHLQLFLPHDKLYVTQRLDSLWLPLPVKIKYEDGTELTFETGKVQLTLNEDWSFPSDPWKREGK